MYIRVDKWEVLEIEREKGQDVHCKKAKKIHDGVPNYKDPGLSAKKIDKNIAKFKIISTDVSPDLKEGTIFMDLSALFNVFDVILKCPECNSDMSTQVNMNKKNGFSHHIVLQCKSTECDWKYCFNTSKKQGHSHEVNVRAVLAFREIGRGHTAMTTFSKVMNMPTPPTRKN